jgi:hypothetical protein
LHVGAWLPLHKRAFDGPIKRRLGNGYFPELAV